MDLRLVEIISIWGPTQFEARTSDDRPVYVRYRSGWLTVDIGRPGAPGGSCLGVEFTVCEMNADSLCGDLESITWDEALALLAPLDLQSRLDELEAQEREYRARWMELFKSIRTRELPGISFRTLQLAEIPWVTPYENGVGRYDFEWALRDFCDRGVCAYSHIDPRTADATVKVLLMPDAEDRWNAVELAIQVPKQFGSVQLAFIAGATSGESEDIAPAEVEAAFNRIADRLLDPHP